MFSRRESAGDLGLVMKRRMAQYRISRMMAKVKEVEKDNFDGKIYNEIGKNKASLCRKLDNSQYLHKKSQHGQKSKV